MTATKEKPIIFSAPMIRAILEGRKTQTRRIVKPQPYYRVRTNGHGVWFWGRNDLREYINWDGKDCEQVMREGMPEFAPYPVNSRMWVREALQWRNNGGEPVEDGHVYAASPDVWLEPLVDEESLPRARNISPIHMPRWASRITLEVTGVRVERVQDITPADAIAEGIGHDDVDAAVADYAALWDRVNGKGSWDVNPWVWVYSFKRVSP